MLSGQSPTLPRPSNPLRVAIVGLTGLPMPSWRWRLVPGTAGRTDASCCRDEVPTVASTLLFLLVLTGPPRLRFRDPLASIRGDVDAVVVFHIIVWVLAGIWVFHQLSRNHSHVEARTRLGLPQRVGILFLFCLALSALVSESPLLTLFIVYQMGVMLFLGFFFVRRYGPRACLVRLFWGYTILLVSSGILALAAPAAAFQALPSGGLQLRVDWITLGVGQVAALAIILLLTIALPIPRVFYPILFALYVAILVLSYTRSAYLCLFAFVVLALVKRTKSVAPRRFALLLLAAVALLLPTDLLPRIGMLIVRETETLGNLTGRTGLWAYLTDITLTRSPWIGLGYYTAARVYGVQYSTWSGTAHSAFMDVFVGGGLLSIALFILLWSVLLLLAISLLLRTRDRYAFAACSLLLSLLVVSQVGEGINPGPFGFTFWCLAAILPQLQSRQRFDPPWDRS